jgi:hypothetical protein
VDPWPSQFVALFFRDKTPLALSGDVRIAASVVQSKNHGDAAPAPTGFAEIVSYDLPVFHLMSSAAPLWLSFTVFAVRVMRVSGNADHSAADRTSDRAGAARE